MKKSRGQRLGCLLVALILLVSVFAACSKPEEKAAATTGATAARTEAATTSGTASGSVPAYLDNTEPVTFDWYVGENWYGQRVQWGRDLTSQYIEKKTGVKLNIIVPPGEHNEKMNVMIASSDLPDFISMGHYFTQMIFT